MPEGEPKKTPSDPSAVPAKTNGEEDLAESDADATQLPLPPGLDHLPPTAQKSVMKMLSFGMQMGGPPPEIIAKITPEHISETIRQSGESSEREFRDANRARWFSLAHYAIGAVAIVYLAIMLGPTSPGLLEKIFTWLVIAGGGVGIGIGRVATRRKQ